MINLLPPQQKEELLREEQLKLIMILGILVLFFFISLALVLFSIKILIQAEVGTQNAYFNEKEMEIDSLNAKELGAKIKEYNSFLSQLVFFYQNHRDSTEILEKISPNLPKGVYLNSLNVKFSTSEKEKYLAEVSLTGYSPTQEILLEFKESLERTDDFEEVRFPLEIWVKPVDINFSANFKIAK